MAAMRFPSSNIARIAELLAINGFIFSDIITVYGMDYVVSGPVWEYYSGYNWENGLIQELKDDKLCGFTGKTVIHPNQISVVNKVYQVTRSDFNDAKAILNWDKKSDSLVSGNLAGERMNEYKTHHNWAEKILFLADFFGMTDQTDVYINFFGMTRPN